MKGGEDVQTLHRGDRRLVKRMLAGDEGAFDEFFDAYYPGLYRFLLPRMTGDHVAAEDIAQATICKGIRKLHTYRGEAALFTWLCTICRRTLADEERKRARRWQRVRVYDDAPEVRAALDSLAATDDDPIARLRREEVSRQVQETLDRLPRPYGQALRWKYMQELPVAEIAARLGLGHKAAESLLTRARRAFRDGFRTIRDVADPAREADLEGVRA